jgi:hypothetical protein
MKRIALVALALAAAVAPLQAQSAASRVPPGQAPPAGMCRVWIDGVPPGQQPPPTDCETARRWVAGQPRILYGSNADRYGWDKNAPGRESVCYDRNGSQVSCQTSSRDAVCYDRSGRRIACEANGQSPTSAQPRRSAYPSTMPSMAAGLALRQGRRSADTDAWLAGAQVAVKFYDPNSDGKPEKLTFEDRSGRTVQEWMDYDADGRADRVRIYREGKLIDTIDR